MPFAITYYHIVWTTEAREEILTRNHEPALVDTLYEASEALGCKVFAVSVMPDHVHTALSIPPRLAVSEWLKRIQTLTARAAAEAVPDAPVRWSQGFGVITFGSQNKDKVIRYVKRQRAIHAEGALTEALERVDD